MFHRILSFQFFIFEVRKEERGRQKEERALNVPSHIEFPIFEMLKEESRKWKSKNLVYFGNGHSKHRLDKRRSKQLEWWF